MDVVSYEQRHNEANGEDNRDGHAHNLSCNYGTEGPTENPGIIGLRRQQRLNMLATLLFSQGTPMLLAGDELGNTQHGNNNAYAQDNETSWLDWTEFDEGFVDQVRELIWLRREMPLLRVSDYVHGKLEQDNGSIQIRWVNKDGQSKQSDEWASSQAFSVLIEEKNIAAADNAIAILLNRYDETTTLQVPLAGESLRWHVAFSSGENSRPSISDQGVSVPGRSITLLTAS